MWKVALVLLFCMVLLLIFAFPLLLSVFDLRVCYAVVLDELLVGDDDEFQIYAAIVKCIFVCLI